MAQLDSPTRSKFINMEQQVLFTKCHDVACKFSLEGRFNFLPEELANRYKCEFGAELPFEQFGFKDAGEFLESNPLFFRMNEYDGDRRLRIYVSEKSMSQCNLRQGPSNGPPIINLDSQPPEPPSEEPPTEEHPPEKPPDITLIQTKKGPVDECPTPPPPSICINPESVIVADEQQQNADEAHPAIEDPRAKAPAQQQPQAAVPSTTAALVTNIIPITTAPIEQCPTSVSPPESVIFANEREQKATDPQPSVFATPQKEAAEAQSIEGVSQPRAISPQPHAEIPLTANTTNLSPIEPGVLEQDQQQLQMAVPQPTVPVSPLQNAGEPHSDSGEPPPKANAPPTESLVPVDKEPVIQKVTVPKPSVSTTPQQEAAKLQPTVGEPQLKAAEPQHPHAAVPSTNINVATNFVPITTAPIQQNASAPQSTTGDPRDTALQPQDDVPSVTTAPPKGSNICSTILASMSSATTAPSQMSISAEPVDDDQNTTEPQPTAGVLHVEGTSPQLQADTPSMTAVFPKTSDVCLNILSSPDSSATTSLAPSVRLESVDCDHQPRQKTPAPQETVSAKPLEKVAEPDPTGGLSQPEATAFTNGLGYLAPSSTVPVEPPMGPLASSAPPVTSPSIPVVQPPVPVASVAPTVVPLSVIFLPRGPPPKSLRISQGHAKSAANPEREEHRHKKIRVKNKGHDNPPRADSAVDDEEDELHQPVVVPRLNHVNQLNSPVLIDLTQASSPVRQHPVSPEQKTLVDRAIACLCDLYLQCPAIPCTLQALNKAFDEIFGSSFIDAFQTTGKDFSSIRILSEGEITCEKVHKTWHFGLKNPPRDVPTGEAYRPMDRPFKRTFTDSTEERDLVGPIHCVSPEVPLVSRQRKTSQSTVRSSEERGLFLQLSTRRSFDPKLVQAFVQRVERSLVYLENNDKESSRDGYYDLSTVSSIFSYRCDRILSTEFEKVFPKEDYFCLEKASNGRIRVDRDRDRQWSFALCDGVPAPIWMRERTKRERPRAPEKKDSIDPKLVFGKDNRDNRLILVDRVIRILQDGPTMVNEKTVYEEYLSRYGSQFVPDCLEYVNVRNGKWQMPFAQVSGGEIQMLKAGKKWNFKLVGKKPERERILSSSSQSSASTVSSSDHPAAPRSTSTASRLDPSSATHLPQTASTSSRLSINKLPLIKDVLNGSSRRIPVSMPPPGLLPTTHTLYGKLPSLMDISVATTASQLAPSEFYGPPPPPDLLVSPIHLDMPERLRQCLLVTGIHRCDQKWMKAIYSDIFSGDDLNMHLNRAYGTSSPENVAILLEETAVELFNEGGIWIYELRAAPPNKKTSTYSTEERDLDGPIHRLSPDGTLVNRQKTCKSTVSVSERPSGPSSTPRDVTRSPSASSVRIDADFTVVDMDIDDDEEEDEPYPPMPISRPNRMERANLPEYIDLTQSPSPMRQHSVSPEQRRYSPSPIRRTTRASRSPSWDTMARPAYSPHRRSTRAPRSRSPSQHRIESYSPSPRRRTTRTPRSPSREWMERTTRPFHFRSQDTSRDHRSWSSSPERHESMSPDQNRRSQSSYRNTQWPRSRSPSWDRMEHPNYPHHSRRSTRDSRSPSRERVERPSQTTRRDIPRDRSWSPSTDRHKSMSPEQNHPDYSPRYRRSTRDSSSPSRERVERTTYPFHSPRRDNPRDDRSWPSSPESQQSPEQNSPSHPLRQSARPRSRSTSWDRMETRKRGRSPSPDWSMSSKRSRY